MTLKVYGGEVPPVSVNPLGLVTVIENVPDVATRYAGTVAFNVFTSTNLVVNVVSPKLIPALLWKFVPATVKMKLGEPAFALLGTSEVIWGIFLTMNSTLREVPPVSPEFPGLVIVTGTIPAVAKRRAGTITARIVPSEDMLAGISRSVPKLTQASLWNSVPPIVNRN